MALRSFPAPGVVLWGKELGIHLSQLVDPLFGGINTWSSTPALGPDGFPLSTDHRGFTGLNLNNHSLEYWDGVDWHRFDLGAGSDLPPLTNYQMSFTNAQLDSNGNLAIPHNLGHNTPTVFIWDETLEQVWPDRVKSISPNLMQVNLASFMPLMSPWLAYVSL